MRILILDAAEQDLADGFDFYEAQSTGLGEYFLDSLSSDIESLRLYAGIHPEYQGYHRLLSQRFPFAVYYRIVSRVIRVYAVLDCRRDPSWITSRLQ